MKVGFGFCLPHFGNFEGREYIRELAIAAEENGFETIWTTDHIAIGQRYKYPYGRITESLVTLAYIAPLTEHVKLGTSIIVLPMRNTLLFAKQVATLDYLTGGRVIVGVASGWESTEFRNLGVDYRSRGKLLDEQIRLLRVLWSSETPTFKGKFHEVGGVYFSPLPPSRGGPPIWVGGNSERAARRAIELADGWHPTGIDVVRFTSFVEKFKMRRQGFVLSGRFTVDLTGKKGTSYKSSGGEERVIISGRPSDVIERFSEYVDQGMSHIGVYLGDKKKEEVLNEMRLFASEVMPSFS